jgi:hypothetical protein
MHNFESLKDVFENHPGLSGVRKKVHEAEVVNDFLRIFPDMNKMIVPVKVEKKILYLRVENSVLKSEIKFNESVMVEKINRYFNDIRIEAVRFTA